MEDNQPKTKICNGCGNLFESKQPDKIMQFCSEACEKKVVMEIIKKAAPKAYGDEGVQRETTY